jgi:putative flippase GtrA
MRQLIDQGGRFVLIGLLSTLVHYLVIVALVDGLHWLPPTPSTVAGSVLGIAIAYLGNYHYVFMPDDRRHTVYADPRRHDAPVR